MSVRAVRAALALRDERLNASDRFVLVVYAEHANKDTEKAWPSARTIADETGYNEDTVLRATGKLRRLGYLVQVGKRRHGDRAWTWIYEVHFDVPTSERDVEAEDPTSTGRGTDIDVVEDPLSRRTNRKYQPVEEPLVGSADAAPTTASLDEARTRRRDLLFDAIVEVCELEPSSMTRSAAAVVGKTRRELADVGATPDGIRERAEEYHRKFRGAALTPTALLKHWPSLTPTPPPSRDTWLYR